MSDIIDTIDRAIGCQQCRRPLEDSPSTDFCGEDCQKDWQHLHLARIPDPVKAHGYILSEVQLARWIDAWREAGSNYAPYLKTRRPNGEVAYRVMNMPPGIEFGRWVSTDEVPGIPLDERPQASITALAEGWPVGDGLMFWRGYDHGQLIMCIAREDDGPLTLDVSNERLGNRYVRTLSLVDAVGTVHACKMETI